MHYKGKIGLAFWRKNTGRCKSRIVDQDWIVISCPLYRVRRIGYDDLKGFIIPMLGTDKRIFTGYVELIVVDVMQMHVDSTEVICGDVDLLAKETLSDIVFPQYLCCLQKQRIRRRDHRPCLLPSFQRQQALLEVPIRTEE